MKMRGKFIEKLHTIYLIGRWHKSLTTNFFLLEKNYYNYIRVMKISYMVLTNYWYIRNDTTTRPKMISGPIYWQQYGQYIGRILATLPTLAQYMGNMWLWRLSRILATLFPISCPYSCHIFFSQSVGHIISVIWENYGPYSTEAPEPHMAHILPIHCPQIFFYAGYLLKLL